MEDLLLKRLARRCPRCGGPVFRHLGAWRQILYLLPFHLGARTAHRCMRCRAEYVSGNTPSDYLLTGGFLGAHLLLGKSWWVSLVFLAAWLGVTAYFHRSGYFGPIHTFIAAILVASLWFPGLAVRDAIPAGVLAKWGGNLFAVAVGGALLCAIAVLWLDKRAAPALRQKDAARRGKGSPEPGIRTSSRRFHGLLMMGCQDKSTGSAAS